jgi:glutaminyl-tRNA synthetase
VQNVEWMGFKPYKITYSSDYFDQLYELACELLLNGDGYVCSCPSEVMRKRRENGEECEHRACIPEENMKLFEEMREGVHKQGTMCMRMKGDMKANNTTMRDLVAYRILHMPHPHVGDKWCIYPSYDFTHCIVDSLENITHSLCTLEFRVRREPYEWLLHRLSLYCPPQREFSRLVLTHVMLSKRKLRALVERKLVDGWEDPRLPTLRAYRRRGYTADAIRDMCNRLSVTGAENTVISHDLLDYTLRLHLDTIAPRKFIVLHPLKVTITNFPEDRFEKISVLDFPV